MMGLDVVQAVLLQIAAYLLVTDDREGALWWAFWINDGTGWVLTLDTPQRQHLEGVHLSDGDLKNACWLALFGHAPKPDH